MGDYNRSGGGGRSFGGRGFGPRNFGRGGGRGGDRPMFKTVCSNCGDACEVPFRPTNGKPVYCSNCFEKMGSGGHTDAPRTNRPRFEAPRMDQGNNQLDAICVKLDKIIKLLEPKAVDEVKSVTPVEKSEDKKVKPVKPKKIASLKKK